MNSFFIDKRIIVYFFQKKYVVIINIYYKMPVKHIQSMNELKYIMDHERRPILIKFSAAWCGPCKMITPVFVQFSNNPQYDKSIVFAEVDVDQSPVIAEYFGVSSMPTFKVVRNGTVYNEFSGASKDKLLQLINSCL